MGRLAVNAAFKVHSTLLPGLLESVYEICMAHVLTKGGVNVQRQVMVPVVFEGLRCDAGFRLDLLVEN